MNPSPSPAFRAGLPVDEEQETREHDAFMRTLDPVVVAAAEWHTRREEGLGVAEEEHFQHWLAADPAHGRAYERLDKSVNTLRSLPGARAAALRVSLPDQPRRTQRPARSPSRLASLLPRPAALALCCVMLAVAGIAWQQWQQPTFMQQYASLHGQRINTTLPDGSDLALDATTRVGVSLYRDRREVHLSEGQAMFTVAPDPTKPFRVLAGPARITVVGTRFSVRYVTTGSKGGIVEVAVEEGCVAVDGVATPAQAGNTAAMLTAGQAVQVSAVGVVGSVMAVPVSAVAPWRKGLLRFSDTPLSEVIEALEYYGSTGLVVNDPDVAKLRLGGSFEIARPGALAQVLPQILPVKLKPYSDDRQEVVSAR